MKTIRVAILIVIMLGFVQILKTEAKLSCLKICLIGCVASELPYPICFAECIGKCKNVL